MIKPLAVFVILGCTGTASFAQSQAKGPAVKTATVVAVSKQPVPEGAQPATSAGLLGVAFNTANDPKDDDPSWIAKFDLDGDGRIDATTFTWDDEDKVLFAFADTGFKCRNGGEGSGKLLVAVNAAGNRRSRQAGAGFWIAELDAKECGAPAGIWGCQFDAGGNVSACGAAAIDDKNDTIAIAASKP